MKKIASLLLLILCCSLASCGTRKELPDEVALQDVAYVRAFVGELYPRDDGFPGVDTETVKYGGVSYYRYPLSSFDCYIAYDLNGEPNVYFAKDQYDEAIACYQSAEQFDYFCLLGNLHDETEQTVYTVPKMDPALLDRLLAFSRENDYDPLTSFNNEEGLIRQPIPDLDDWMADEIHLYKESKDGAFSTMTGHTFILLEDGLYLLYWYDFAEEAAPVMLLRKIPHEIGDPFCAWLKALHA